MIGSFGGQGIDLFYTLARITDVMMFGIVALGVGVAGNATWIFGNSRGAVINIWGYGRDWILWDMVSQQHTVYRVYRTVWHC